MKSVTVSNQVNMSVPKTDTENYSTLLKMNNLKFKETSDGYLEVRQPVLTPGWILNISIVKSQIAELLKILIPILNKEKLAFKIVKDKITATLLLDGRLGYANVGKLLTIFPNDNEAALRIAKAIIPLTSRFRGPDIPTDLHIGGTVYTRYRAISQGKEICSIPFQYPKGIAWPFAEISPVIIPKTAAFINDTCLITSTIKTDAKGIVSKGLRLNGWRIEQCLVKEGKHDMFSDDNGRSIQDRLSWQYKLQRELTNLPLPKVYGLVQQNNNSYLVMEFVKGTTSLHSAIDKVYKNRCWADLELSGKREILNYLLQVIDIICNLHQYGIIHRDVTPANFLSDKRSKLIVLDLELAYSTKDKFPNPPFNFGTNGFMSPEQQRTQEPTTREDIYGLGALMIVCFTNLYPGKYGTFKLKEKLNFFIHNETLTNMITNCLHTDPRKRPELPMIKETLMNYLKSLREYANEDLKTNLDTSVDLKSLDTTITESILALSTPLMAEDGKPWHSNTEDGKLVANKQRSRCYYPGLNGAAGVMYLLALAKNADINITKLIPVCTRSLNYIRNNFSKAPNILPPGLYEGSHGIAVFYVAAIESGLITDSVNNSNLIKQCLTIEACGLSIASGVSGQGLAVLYCLDFLKEDVAANQLKRHINVITTKQLSDGSWICDENSNAKQIGFSHGVSGIVIFLIEYYKYHQDEKVKAAILKALHWLKRQARLTGDTLTWWISDKEKIVNPWLSNGLTGIALCFIKAFEVFQNTLYKEIAEATLYNNPRKLVCGNFGLMEGISGLGEVYLEAAMVFKNEEWQQRAEWIANTLVHARVHQENSSHWIIDENKIPTADLMTGNSGTIHFLLRYRAPNEFYFPIIKSA